MAQEALPEQEAAVYWCDAGSDICGFMVTHAERPNAEDRRGPSART
jgi:hypothetical protein